MKIEKIEERVNIPNGLTFAYENGVCKVSGPKGQVEKKLFYPGLDIKAEGKDVVLSYKNATKMEKKIVYTYRAHLRNLFNGAENGVSYELKICSGHFPMNVSLSGDKLTVKNFIGEKVPRVLVIKNGVNVKIDGDKITVEHPNKEFAAQTAADIEKLTRRTGFDRRIFQDGIYIVNKNGKTI